MKRVISLFSGAGTFDYGFHQAGWETVYLCEWDEKARQVLRARFPGVPITNDVCEVNGADLPDAEVIMFGSPCQDLSIAGKRAGLDGAKSGLFLEAIRIIKEKREATNGRYPTIALWENVPGALSSNDRRDFAAVIHEFLNSGARDCCWRVLDAKFFGVPQERRRLFVVSDFGGERSREILFERNGSSGTHSTRRPNGRASAAPIACPSGQRSTVWKRRGGFGWTEAVGYAPTLEAWGKALLTEGRRGLRVLTPKETERLNGMADGWGEVQGVTDEDRYRFMGNGGAAPVLKWLAERIAAVL